METPCVLDGCACVLSYFSGVRLFATPCGPMDPSLPGSSVHGILQAGILEWVHIPSPEDLPNPGNEPWSPTLQADSLSSELPGKPREGKDTCYGLNCVPRVTC